MKQTDTKVGVISDTHGLLRPEIPKLFENIDFIIHAGDIGTREVLEKLRIVAPVFAVRGNMDSGRWTYELPITETVEIENGLLYVLHDINRLDLTPVTAGIRGVIYGHSHRPSITKHEGVLYLNPGSAGPRRFTLPVTVALLHIQGASLNARIVTL